MPNKRKPIITITNIVANSKISGFDVDIILKKIHGANQMGFRLQ